MKKIDIEQELKNYEEQNGTFGMAGLAITLLIKAKLQEATNKKKKTTKKTTGIVSSKRARKLRKRPDVYVKFSHNNSKGTAFYVWEAL
ncbi:hypothetical protein JAO10_09185 [Burkholderia contaminans]|uniref:hypothetical protein n=1 Tax=Burkholderia contaminans TaxID=488447 RepID=UPI0018DBEB6D|nr:hypothetical protein [Burkholderia contaminans]MBH9720505.1 hypothetical protein [Burkholderia contaminans]